MLGYSDNEDVSEYPGVITSEQLAETVVRGVQAEHFLILPHPDVEKFIQFKTGDYDRWLGGMRKTEKKNRQRDWERQTARHAPVRIKGLREK